MSEQTANPGITHINSVWRQTVANIKAEAVAEQAPYVEKYATFIIGVDGGFDVQLYPNGAYPLMGKVYKIRIPVPTELVGPVVEAGVKEVK